ncbi:hypothetical protein BaRGS_00013952, partial [Batillaria attramentaria]
HSRLPTSGYNVWVFAWAVRRQNRPCHALIAKINAGNQHATVGDLKRFSTVQDHHTAQHGFDCNYFTRENRPHCVKARYSLCEVTPVGALRGADQFRKDGLRSSNQFKLWPILLREHEVKTDDMNLPRHKGQAMTFNKKYKRLKPRPRTIHSVESLASLQQEEDNASSTADATTSLSKSQPSILVAVDTSGVGFQRMSSFRQSLKGTVSLKGTASLDRKKRRRTVSGVPENIMHEIEHFERGRKATRSTPRNYSFDDLDFRKEAEREAVMLQYLDEMDAKMEERAEQERASREMKLLKFLPCRRSRSLPRCVKVGTSQCKGVMVFEQDEGSKDEGSKDKSITTATTSGYASSSLSLGSAGGSSTSSRTTKRSSIISNKIKSFVQGTLRPRPKSCDFDAIDVLGSEADHEEESTEHKANLKRKFSPSMPDDISSMSSSRESKVGPGTYYYFNSHTLPRAQARKYDFPWDSLPKDWTTAVKLREISKRRREERNSSSGNWSGSSNRQSLDSARSSTLPSSTSQYSLGRDSGRDSPSMGDDKSGTDAGYHADHTSTDSNMSTFMPLGTTSAAATKDSQQDTEEWLASLAKRAAAREDAARGGVDVTESLTRLSQLTKQNILALEESISPGMHRPLRLDDEVSSEYSLDQEGFYTSFHNDSGLRRSSGTLLDEEDGDRTPVKETLSMPSMGSNNTVDSVVFNPQGDPASNGDSGECAAASTSAGKLRPPPPVRSGSRLSSTSSLADSVTKSESTSSVLTVIDSYAEKESLLAKETKPGEESSPSESDQEMIYARLKTKTRISRHSIPSWCSVSDEDSTDSSSMNLSGLAPQDGASVSFSGSPSSEETIRNTSTPLSDSASAESGSKGQEVPGASWKNSTLPRQYLESKLWEEDMSEQSNSWPRSRRSQQQQPTAGILKREKSPAGSLKPKTLNFAPVVSLYDHHTSQGFEIPLCTNSSTSSSSSVDGSSDATDSSLSYKVAMPLLPNQGKGAVPSQVDRKYQPTITVKPGQVGEMRNNTSQIIYPHTLIRADSTPVTAPHYAVLPVKGMRQVSAESPDRSVSSSESSIPSLSDCGRGGYLDMGGDLSHRNQDSLSSSSSACLSDIDSSSLTYVSMSSPNSTPTNSTLNLGPDRSETSTPINSPVHENDTYGISSVTLSGAHHPSSGNTYIPESGPVLQAPSLPQQTVPHHSETNHRQSLSSFSANASTEAAPSSWVAEKVAGRALQNSVIVDSGFSSPTTPTNFGSDQRLDRPQGVPHSETWSNGSAQSTVLQKQEPHRPHDFRTNGDGSGTDVRRFRTSAPPDQLALGQKHEPLKAMHSLGAGVDHTAPRSDSYRVAMTTDFSKTRSHSRDRGSSSVKARAQPGRSRSSSQMSSNHAHSYHPGMTKSVSCPTGSMEDPDIVSRADSYRIAVRNTQGIVGEMATRNTSYRMATGDNDPVSDSRMDALNSWGGERRRSSGRDVRRMGITDIDQLKCYDSDSSNHSMSSRTSTSSLSGKSLPTTFAGINTSRKKMKPEVQNLLLSNKSPSPQTKRMSKSSSKTSKDKDKSKPQTSTYIRFDPIFEDRDDMYSSSDTLRAESVEMLASEDGFLMGHQIVSQLPPGKVKGNSGRKTVDEKAVTSILDSIKTTIKSMSGKSSADKDMWRYEGGI